MNLTIIFHKFITHNSNLFQTKLLYSKKILNFNCSFYNHYVIVNVTFGADLIKLFYLLTILNQHNINNKPIEFFLKKLEKTLILEFLTLHEFISIINSYFLFQIKISSDILQIKIYGNYENLPPSCISINEEFSEYDDFAKYGVLSVFTETLDKESVLFIHVLYKFKLYVFNGANCVDNFFKFIFNFNNKVIWFVFDLTFQGSLLLSNLSLKINNTSGFFFNHSMYTLNLQFSKNEHSFLNTKQKTVSFRCLKKFLPVDFNLIESINETDLERWNFNFFLNNIFNLNIYEHAAIFTDQSINLTRANQVSNFYKNIWTLFNIFFILSNMIKLLDKSVFFQSVSISSYAKKIYRKKFNEYSISLSLPTQYDTLLRMGYFGGRTEIFANAYPGKFIFHYDFHSMYGQVMLEEFPLGEVMIEQLPKHILKDGFYFVDVESNLKIPLLPYKYNLKLIFPNGRFSGLYSGEMLLYFQEKGGIVKKIHYKIYTNNCAHVFEKFSNFFLNLRKKNALGKLLGKLIITSFYGRLGIKPVQLETELFINDITVFDRLSNFIITETRINNVILVDKLKNKVKDEKYDYVSANIFYASLITSKGQLDLYKNFDIIFKKNCRLLYVDTDSYYIESAVSILGQYFNNIYWNPLKDDVFFKKAFFALPKAYALLDNQNKSTVKIKGFPRNSMSFDQFISITNPDNWLKKKNKSLEINTISVKELDAFILTKKYTKRVFINNKHDTIPLRIDHFYNFKWKVLELEKSPKIVVFYLKTLNKPFYDLLNIFSSNTIVTNYNSIEGMKLKNMPFIRIERTPNSVRYSSSSSHLLTCWYLYWLDFLECRLSIESSFFLSHPISNQKFELLVKLNEETFFFEHFFNDTTKIDRLMSIQYELTKK